MLVVYVILNELLKLINVILTPMERGEIHEGKHTSPIWRSCS